MRRLLLALVVALLVLTPHAHEARAIVGIGPIVVPPPSSPGDVGNLLVWLRADQVVSPANGAKFASWLDLANGNTYTQPTSLIQYTWNAADAQFGGQPSIASNTSANMPTTVATVAQPFTVYSVLATTNVSAYQIVVTDSSDVTETGFTSSGYYYYAPGTNTGGIVNVTTGPHAVAWVHNGSSSAIYADTSATPVGTNAVTSGGTSATWSIGYSGNVDGLIGNEAEVLIYKSAHSAAQVSAVFAYFSARYGQTWH